MSIIKHRRVVSVCFVIFAITILYVGIYYKLWTFHDIQPYIIGGLIGGIPPFILYGFKPSETVGIDKHEDEKNRLDAHHKDIIKVFEKWCEITVSPANQKEGLYTTSFPFYVEIVENIRSNDKFGEALSHIGNGKEYKKCLDLYNSMETLENSHNQKVSEFMKETEENIRTSISNDTEISLVERSGFNLPTISSINLSQAPEPTQDFYAWVQETYCGYDLSAIFDHFVKQSMKTDEKTLEIGTFDTSLGYLYPKLFRRGAPLETIAISLPSTRNRIIKLKELIDTVPEDTIKQIGEFAGNINKMRDFLNAFRQCIEQIIHDEISLGLKGRCEKENKLSQRYIVNTKVSSFFGSKSRVGRSTLF